jgi:hypothetical protein
MFVTGSIERPADFRSDELHADRTEDVPQRLSGSRVRSSRMSWSSLRRSLIHSVDSATYWLIRRFIPEPIYVQAEPALCAVLSRAIRAERAGGLLDR